MAMGGPTFQRAIQRLHLPAGSPDANLIDHVWNMLQTAFTSKSTACTRGGVEQSP